MTLLNMTFSYLEMLLSLNILMKFFTISLDNIKFQILILRNQGALRWMR